MWFSLSNHQQHLQNDMWDIHHFSLLLDHPHYHFQILLFHESYLWILFFLMVYTFLSHITHHFQFFLKLLIRLVHNIICHILFIDFWILIILISFISNDRLNKNNDKHDLLQVRYHKISCIFLIFQIKYKVHIIPV